MAVIPEIMRISSCGEKSIGGRQFSDFDAPPQQRIIQILGLFSFHQQEFVTGTSDEGSPYADSVDQLVTKLRFLKLTDLP
ncbi:hypothetical protein EGT07_05320 [Herbaspirillum sp. HC18]|nr:hypothetical protein EGT07_05320 [Herbaspirillum sp. HC18]